MAYKVNQHNSFEKGFKKIDAQHHIDFLDHCDALTANPLIGENTKGALHTLGMKKYKITSTNPQYRILYKVYTCEKPPAKNKKFICSNHREHENQREYNECNGIVDFILCGTREMFNNLYKLPLDKAKKYL